MAKKEGSKKAEPKSAPKGVDINVDGNVEKSNIVVGDNNVINNYYQIVEKNTKPNDPDYWNLKHPYPMPPNFTGRLDERAMLTQWLDADAENRLFILRALGGFGKSALAWQWLTHDVNPEKWKKVIFWSFYEGDSSFEHFVEETLKYLKLDVPQNKREQVETLLRAMQAEPILLILDGFERALRAYNSLNAAYQGDEETSPTPQPPSLSSPKGAPKGEEGGEVSAYDCVDMNAEAFLKGVCALPRMKGKVLMTTRLTPRAVYVGARVGASAPAGHFASPLQGCCEIELTAMQPADAVDFFHKQGIQGNRGEIEAACAPYGYHPLSLRLLAGRILKDFENPADIVVAQKLKINGDIIQQKHHVLEVSYNSLPEPEQKLLSTIACFRAPVELGTLEAITVGTRYIVSLQDQLHDLIERGLLHFDRHAKKFDLHPIVRRYAYDRLTDNDRTDAHTRLVNYFEAVPTPQKVTTLEDLAPVIELYHHMVRAGNLDEAIVLYRDRLDPLYYQFGAYQLIVELLRALFPDGEDNPPRLKDEAWQAYTLNDLASVYSLSGQPRRAVPLFEIIYENKTKNKKHLAIGLGNVAGQQMVIGALSKAEHNLCRQIDLCREIADEFVEAVGHQELGRVLSYRGAWQEAEQELDSAIAIQQKIKHVQTEGLSNAYHALRFLLMARDSDSPAGTSQLSVESCQQKAIEAAQRALELADEDARTDAPTPRDYVRAYWMLGSAYRAVSVNSTTEELTLAEENLSKALNLSRQINNVESEADILLDLAQLRYAQQNYDEAKSLGEEALTITERSGYVLQGADVHLFLATLALEGYTLERFRFDDKRELSDKEVARKHAEEALRLAHCDDGPPHYYKVAYEEAERLLETFKIERG